MIAVGCHPVFRLVLAHNREEKRNRPSGEEQLESSTKLICGRDLQAGGTVMGMHSVLGHFAALTNCASPHTRDAATRTSRGKLVEHLMMHGPEAAASFLSSNELEGFHVVFGNVFSEDPHVSYAWNFPEEDATGALQDWKGGHKELGSEVFVVSNENFTMDESWPKCQWLKKQVQEFMEALPVSPPPEAALVHRGLAEIMGKHGVSGIQPPPRWPRDFPPEKETLLHTGAFSPWTQEFPEFGTVSQRIVLSDAQRKVVSWYHRSTNLKDEKSEAPVIGEWDCLQVPWPSAGAPAAGRL